MNVYKISELILPLELLFSLHLGVGAGGVGQVGDRSDASAALAYLARSYANFSVKSSRLHCEYGLRKIGRAHV